MRGRLGRVSWFARPNISRPTVSISMITALISARRKIAARGELGSPIGRLEPGRAVAGGTVAGCEVAGCALSEGVALAVAVGLTAGCELREP